MSATPIAFDKSKLAGEGLDEMPLWPPEILKKGVESHRSHGFFAGEIVSMVYDADDGLLEFNDYPFDEFVHVLNGTSILTAAGGSPQEFKTGDTFVVPKGFNGTWEMRDNFRELIVMEANALAEGMKKFGFA